MRLVLSALLIIWLQAIAISAYADKTIKISIATKGPWIEIRSLDDPSMAPHIASASSIDRLRAVYFTLECFVNKECSDLKSPDESESELIEPDELETALEEGTEHLLGPFAKRIQLASEVKFRIDWSLIKIPFDLLHLDGRPMFLSKKVSYSIGNAGLKALPTPSRRWTGLLVSDETADPQRAIFALKESFPKSQLFDIEDFGLTELQRLTPVDFVAISGHGLINGKGDGYISIANKEQLRPYSLTHLRPKLVYFDSCNLGVSAAHLKSLQNAGTSYVLAPILSNEAGNSSTATIESFFTELVNGADPAKALFLTRAKLYERYKSADIRTALWRSFPFRVYQLN